MTEEQLSALKYPIGKFDGSAAIEKLQSNIKDIQMLPSILKEAVIDLSNIEVNWIYRPGGWTIKQVVNHFADSHMNSLLRYKWTLTEESPIIMPYDEVAWANLPDSNDDDLQNTLVLIESLHNKWVRLLENMTHEQYEREYVHPASGKRYNLYVNTAIYAWHGKHHVAHIHQALKYQGNFESI